MNLSIGRMLSAPFNCQVPCPVDTSSLGWVTLFFFIGDYPRDRWTRASLCHVETGTGDHTLTLPLTLLLATLCR